MLEAASQRLADKLPGFSVLWQQKEVIVYSYGTRGADLASQLRKAGVDCVIFDNSPTSRNRARDDGFAVTPDLGLDRPLIVAAGQNQISILDSLSRPAWSLAEALYAFDLVNQSAPARQFSDRLPALADGLYDVYRRLDDECRAGFLDVLLFRASLDVGCIAKSRLPIGQMWTLPASVRDIRTFCDVGAYDGDTLHAMKTAYPDLASTFTVEPNPDLIRHIEAVAAGLGLANRHYAGAAWTHAVPLNVHTLPSGMMAIGEDAAGGIAGESLDRMVGADRYDYVKFDVEGAEAPALEGAQATLRGSRAIAVAAYHRPNDLVDIPSQLDRLLQNGGGGWRLAFRHYSESFDDSILYLYRSEAIRPDTAAAR